MDGEDRGPGTGEPPASSRIAVLDGFRGYAILAVVLVHLLGASGVLVRAEGTGLGVAIWGLLGNALDTFFIISAFVLFLPVVRRGGDLGGAVNFWVARCVRLLPAFWVAIALTLLLAFALPPTADYVSPSFAEIAGHLTMLQMPIHFVDAGFRVGFAINGPVWLVSVVIAFYLLLPLIARPYFRHPLVGLGIAAAITIGWKLLLGHRPDLLEPLTNVPVAAIWLFGIDQFPSWVFSFGLGMTGAWAYVQATRRWPAATLARFSVFALLPVLIGIIATAYVRGGYALETTGYISQYARTFPFETMADSILHAALFGIVAVGPLWMQRPFANRTTARLADLSYGVYLFHFILITYAISLLSPPEGGSLGDLLLWIALILPASLLLAWLSRRYVEMPALNRVRPWLTRRKEERAGPTSAPLDTEQPLSSSP